MKGIKGIKGMKKISMSVIPGEDPESIFTVPLKTARAISRKAAKPQRKAENLFSKYGNIIQKLL